MNADKNPAVQASFSICVHPRASAANFELLVMLAAIQCCADGVCRAEMRSNRIKFAAMLIGFLAVGYLASYPFVTTAVQEIQAIRSGVPSASLLPM